MHNNEHQRRDIEALERILFRLTNLADDQILPVLDGLLPQLLQLFPKKIENALEQQLHNKVEKCFICAS